jgi:hypothetical protein
VARPYARELPATPSNVLPFAAPSVLATDDSTLNTTSEARRSRVRGLDLRGAGSLFSGCPLEALCRRAGNPHAVVCLPAALRKDIAALREMEFDDLIVDEGQAIKNAADPVRAPQGATACSLGRQPQVERTHPTLSPNGATAANLAATSCRPSGAFGVGWSPSPGLAPRATCLGSFGARWMISAEALAHVMKEDPARLERHAGGQTSSLDPECWGRC